MSRKNTNKNAPKELKKSISTILVANDKYFRPFIELFEYAGENIIQQQLGTLLGIFEIRDDSEDSAYIVNFLTSVAKKEYFINPKRSVPESFEAALHKVNLALSELANHGNVSWIGKLDAVICVLEKNNLHFSVAGNSKVILLRNQILTDISEDIVPEDADQHPIKTFTNISSGKLETGDKIIVTGEDLFQIFSLTEIKKGALRFDREKFVQFIKTALINELEIAGTIIIDTYEDVLEEKLEEKTPVKKRHLLNVFSEKTFRESVPKKSKSPLPEKIPSEENDYVDKKTGHIYVQGEYQKPSDEKLFDHLAVICREKFSDFVFWVKTGTEKIGASLKRSARDAKENIKKRAQAKIQEIRINAWKKKAEMASKRTPEKAAPNQPSAKIAPTVPVKTNNSTWLTVRTWFSRIRLGKILPDFSKIKYLASKMDYQQRIYAALALVAIFVVPLIWIKLQKNPEPLPVAEVPIELTPEQILAQDKNINLNPATGILYAGANIIGPVFSNETLFIITDGAIIKNGQEQQEFNLAEEWGKTKDYFEMDDLNLIFLVTDKNKLVSFSSVSNKFLENSLAIPENSNIVSFGAYLTYAYLVDSENGQIYRYPRAEADGGFGAKTNWLKETMDLQNVTGMAIDENIYLVNGEGIIKLLKGQREQFNAEQSATPVKFHKIFTDIDTENIYILDSSIGRIVKYSKTGELLAQYYDARLKDASTFTIDEKNNKAYFTTSNELISLGL